MGFEFFKKRDKGENKPIAEEEKTANSDEKKEDVISLDEVFEKYKNNQGDIPENTEAVIQLYNTLAKGNSSSGDVEKAIFKKLDKINETLGKLKPIKIDESSSETVVDRHNKANLLNTDVFLKLSGFNGVLESYRDSFKSTGEYELFKEKVLVKLENDEFAKRRKAILRNANILEQNKNEQSGDDKLYSIAEEEIKKNREVIEKMIEDQLQVA